MQSWNKQLSTSSLKAEFENSGTDFKSFHINYSIPSMLLDMETHVSILRAGNSPHEPHSHPEEELIIILSGKVQIIRSKQSQNVTRSSPLTSGALTYHNSNCAHTIRSVGPEPAIYICVKWNGKKLRNKVNVLSSSDFVPNYIKETNTLNSEFNIKTLFESKTEYLGKLHCHVSHVKPGAGYKSHIDFYDVMIILLDGKIETIRKELESNSVIFYQAGESHGLKNVGTTVAQYIVFEFHGNAYNFSTRMNIHKILKFILKKILPKKILTLFSLPVISKVSTMTNAYTLELQRV